MQQQQQHSLQQLSCLPPSYQQQQVAPAILTTALTVDLSTLIAIASNLHAIPCMAAGQQGGGQIRGTRETGAMHARRQLGERVHFAYRQLEKKKVAESFKAGGLRRNVSEKLSSARGNQREGTWRKGCYAVSKGRRWGWKGAALSMPAAMLWQPLAPVGDASRQQAPWVTRCTAAMPWKQPFERPLAPAGMLS
jgi:hypothetical protein